jgi:hypothetical protein
MVAMMVMQAAVHQVVGMVAMWHGLMTAARAVLMPVVVALPEVRRAPGRVALRYVEAVLVGMIAVGVMEVAVMEVVDVPVVPEGRVSAAGPVLVIVSAAVLLVLLLSAHLCHACLLA